MNVTIRTIPIAEHRYPTYGDWLFTRAGDLEILVADSGDWRYDMLVALHELVEVLLCKHAGITQDQVDAFDIAHPHADEPGALPDAPYRAQHAIAEMIERTVAACLGVNWGHYEGTMERLFDQAFPDNGPRPCDTSKTSTGSTPSR